MDTTFIYALVDPRNSHVRYIGKANDPAARLKRHLKRTDTKNPFLNSWLKSLEAVGMMPFVRIIMEVPKSQWRKWERHWIASFRWAGEKITNIQDGGEGGAWNRGLKGVFHHSEETKAKLRAQRNTPEYKEEMSERAKRQWANMTLEDKIGISERVKGQWAGMTAEQQCFASERAKQQWEKATAEKRWQMSSGARRPKSDATKAKLSIAHKGKVLTQEHRAAISAGHPWKGKKRPEQSRAMKRHYANNPDAHKKTSEASRRMWEDEEIRKKIIASRTGKKRPAQSIAMKRHYANKKKGGDAI